MDINERFYNLIDSILSGKVIIFNGAGISVDAKSNNSENFSSTKSLCKKLADNILDKYNEVNSTNNCNLSDSPFPVALSRICENASRKRFRGFNGYLNMISSIPFIFSKKKLHLRLEIKSDFLIEHQVI